MKGPLSQPEQVRLFCRLVLDTTNPNQLSNSNDPNANMNKLMADERFPIQVKQEALKFLLPELMRRFMVGEGAGAYSDWKTLCLWAGALADVGQDTKLRMNDDGKIIAYGEGDQPIPFANSVHSTAITALGAPSPLDAAVQESFARGESPKERMERISEVFNEDSEEQMFLSSLSDGMSTPECVGFVNDEITAEFCKDQIPASNLLEEFAKRLGPNVYPGALPDGVLRRKVKIAREYADLTNLEKEFSGSQSVDVSQVDDAKTALKAAQVKRVRASREGADQFTLAKIEQEEATAALRCEFLEALQNGKKTQFLEAKKKEALNTFATTFELPIKTDSGYKVHDFSSVNPEKRMEAIIITYLIMLGISPNKARNYKDEKQLLPFVEEAKKFAAKIPPSIVTTDGIQAQLQSNVDEKLLGAMQNISYGRSFLNFAFGQNINHKTNAELLRAAKSLSCEDREALLLRSQTLLESIKNLNATEIAEGLVSLIGALPIGVAMLSSRTLGNWLPQDKHPISEEVARFVLIAFLAGWLCILAEPALSEPLQSWIKEAATKIRQIFTKPDLEAEKKAENTKNSEDIAEVVTENAKSNLRKTSNDYDNLQTRFDLFGGAQPSTHIPFDFNPSIDPLKLKELHRPPAPGR